MTDKFRSVIDAPPNGPQWTPVQVANRVFNRVQSVRDGQFICVLHSCDFIFDSIGFYYSYGAPPVGPVQLLGCKTVA